MNIEQIINNHRKYFETNETLDISFRIDTLKTLLVEIKKNEQAIMDALKEDLNKSESESYMAELGMVYSELKFMIKNIKKLAKVRKVKTPIMHFYSTSYKVSNPYGIVLIMSPWNYPFMLTLNPLIGAIAAGNCITVKPSNYSKATSKIIKKILSIFDEKYISVVQGGREENSQLLNQKFDYIFFTGSTTVGTLVAEKAARNLTPYTLELGGKSPCIVTDSAKVDLAAKRIIWGKMLNSGQTCVAPDYIFAHENIKDELIKSMIKYVKKFYSNNPHKNEETVKIINENHFNRLVSIIDESDKVYGGRSNEKTRQIELAIIDDANFASKAMQEELFGPILPIISFNDIDEVFKKINSLARPLASYLYTEDREEKDKFLSSVYFGGGCINDCIIHLANHNLPFGGLGESGSGSYHGKQSFYTFSHSKSILKKSTAFDINIRYAPFKGKIKIFKLLM